MDWCTGGYPLVTCCIAIEHGPVEIVDLPIKNGGSFHSYVNVYQRVTFFWTGKVDLSIAAALRKALETATEKDQNKSLLDDQYLGIFRGYLGVNEYTTIITYHNPHKLLGFMAFSPCFFFVTPRHPTSVPSGIPKWDLPLNMAITCHNLAHCSSFSDTPNYWLVVSTPLKNISQLGWIFPIYGKIKDVPNHQPDYHIKLAVFCPVLYPYYIPIISPWCLDIVNLVNSPFTSIYRL